MLSLAAVLTSFSLAVVHCFSSDVWRTCELIKIDMCRNLGYNVTSMPNLVGHDNQAEAEQQLQTFMPLIQYGCSSQLKFFLCSAFVPMCTEKVAFPIGPCRSLCKNVQTRCLPVLQDFGYTWPPLLNCSLFPPENNNEHMCMQGPEERAASPAYISDYVSKMNFNRFQKHAYNNFRTSSLMNAHLPRMGMPPVQEDAHTAGAACAQLKHAEEYYYVNRTGRCAHKCDAHVLFSKDNKERADTWVGVSSALCFVSTLFTILTFLIDAARFCYPERSVIFLSMCFCLYSVGYIVRMLGGRYDISCYFESQYGTPLLIQEGLANTNCVIVFLLLYYFGMASSVWWIILTLTWLLAAGLKWGHESIQRQSNYLHLIAWGIPAALTITILVTREIDADELTGVCYVGNQNSKALLHYVLIPYLVFLTIGTTFVISGFLSMCRIRKQMLHKGTKIEKLEALMVRLGVFSILYTVPATCVAACVCYEFLFREEWLRNDNVLKPKTEIFIVKIIMTLSIGITSGMWVWSTKTFHSWRKLCCQFVDRRKKTQPVYLQNLPPISEVRFIRPKLKTGKHSWRNGETCV